MKWPSQTLTRLKSVLKGDGTSAIAAISQLDALIISYPKTGRTWLRMMIGKYLCLRYSLDESKMLDTPALTSDAGLPVIKFAHDGSDLRIRLSLDKLESSKHAYRQKRVLLLTRSIEDSMVSAYFQVSRRLQIFGGTISDFIRDERYGVSKFIKFYSDWYCEQAVPREFSTVSYEQMQNDSAGVLKLALAFSGEEQIDDQLLRTAVEYCSFENMKSVERAGQLDGSMQATDPGDQESYKVRRGVVGGFVDYLSEEDLAYIRSLALGSNCPFVVMNAQVQARANGVLADG